jgi:hypothetical protein
LKFSFLTERSLPPELAKSERSPHPVTFIQDGVLPDPFDLTVVTEGGPCHLLGQRNGFHFSFAKRTGRSSRSLMKEKERTTSPALAPFEGEGIRQIKSMDAARIQGFQCPVYAECRKPSLGVPLFQIIDLTVDLFLLFLKETLKNSLQDLRTFFREIQGEGVRYLKFDPFRQKSPKIGNDSILTDEDDTFSLP